MGLNKQQQAINAIENRKHNIIVPASAGTGKTTTLTARIIEYIKEGKDIDNYLIVSFTEAAASELKERISKELKDSLNGKNESHFKNQLAKLPLANISTIHSFCLEVIKKYGYIKNIDPAIAGKLGNDGVLKQLKQEALTKALEFNKNNELIYVLNDRSEDISHLEKIIQSIDSFIQNLENYEQWKKDLHKRYDAFQKNDWSKYPIDIKDNLNEKLTELESIFSQLKDIVERNMKPDSKVVLKYVDAEPLFKQMLEEAKKECDNENYKSFGRLFIDYQGLPSGQGFKAKNDEDKELRPYFVKKFNKIIKELSKYYYFEETTNKTYAYIKSLLQITENYRNYYNDLKTNLDIIDYQDMLNIALDILSNELIADIYRKKFEEIMIDEYQDTNQLQEKIISLIKRENNVFRVGDVKQSIYKFQNAKPSLMMGLIENHGKNDIVLPLQYNYRSKANIRNFSNYIFNKLMNINEKAYNKNIDDLLLDPEIKEKDSDGKKIQIVSIPTQRIVEDKPVALNGKIKASYICTYIANEICKLKKENKESKWSDFVVLVRTNKYKTTLKNVLNERNIPVFTKAKTGFFNDEAVSNVVSILNLILSNSKLHAFNVLTSTMFDRSYEDIAKNKDLLELNKENEDEESLNSFIKHLRQYKENHSLSELLNVIYAKNDYYMEKINSFQRSNLDSLYQIVLDFEKEDNNIKNLVSYLSTYKTVDREEANSFNNKDDVVQVMTIHQSKGLEFKYVFLADFFFRYDSKKYNSSIQFNEKYGMAMTYTSLPYKIQYPSTYYDFIKNQNQFEDFAEELRVLYVAVTRASEGLYIVGASDAEYLQLTSEDLYNKSMMTWINTALNNAPLEVLDLYDVQDISEQGLKQMNESADKVDKNKYVSSKYSETIGAAKEEKSYSPSQLEDRFINNLSFNFEPGAKRGTIMHKAIELLGIKDIDMKDINGLNLNLDNEDKVKIINFYNNNFTKLLKGYENHHERTFIYLNEYDELENGLIDLLSIDKNDVYIIDFKSDKNTTKEKLINRYQKQQNAYYKVVKNYYNDKNVKMYLYSFYLDEYIEVPALSN